MQVTIDLPEDIAEKLQMKWRDVPRGVLETIALEGYRSGSLTTEHVRRMLGYGTRMQVDEFLKRNDVYLEYTEEDFAHDAETSRSLELKSK